MLPAALETPSTTRSNCSCWTYRREPALQTSPPVHRLPHVPQLAALVWRSTHSELPMKPVHSDSPVGHEQVPPEQLPPAGQAFPQLPQLALLV